MYYLQSSLSKVSKIEQELAIDHMMSEVGLSSYPDANTLMSLKSKAVSPNIKSICSQFNELLETIVKGQEISKANFLGLISSKKRTKLFFEFCPFLEGVRDTKP